MQIREKGRVRLYGCGGTGINLVSKLENTNTNGLVIIDQAYVDTSDSNLGNVVPAEKVYQLEGVDGSGKVRAENVEGIRKAIDPVLRKFTPAALNIVVFSASGGSGSVFGPLLIRALMEQEAPVVAVVIGSSESQAACTNTVKTIKSLDGVSQLADMPIAMIYEHNGLGQTRAQVDARVIQDMMSLIALMSNGIREMDTRDLSNWLYYQRVSTAPRQLAQLQVFSEEELDDAAKVVHPVSMVSLVLDDTCEIPEIQPDYSCVGFYPVSEERETRFRGRHYVISTDNVVKLVNLLDEKAEEYQRIAVKREKDRLTIARKKEDSMAGDGMVL